MNHQGAAGQPRRVQAVKPMKRVYLIMSRDEHVYEMHDPSLGKDSKTLEITYTRK